jgi:hypothetical protein
MIAAAFVAGCFCALGWAARQADVPEQSQLPCDEPERPVGAPVSLVLVQSDGSPVSSRIDLATGELGYSHCYLDLGHVLPDGSRLIVDYQPGIGVHYADGSAYAHRGTAWIRIRGAVGEQVYGCVRAKIGQPFDAAGMLVGRCTVGTCAGLVWSCLPPKARCAMGRAGAPISPNDYARYFGATLGSTVDYEGEG